MPRLRRRALLAGLVLPGLCPRLAMAQDASWLVGGWQGFTHEPATGGPVAYTLTIRADGSYHRTYRPQNFPGGVEDAGRIEVMGNVVHFTIRQWREIPDRGRPAPTGDAYVVEFAGPQAMRLVLANCRWPSPMLCVINLQRVG